MGTPSTLNQLRIGQKAVVSGLASASVSQELRQKLLSMGVVEGSAVEVRRIAPLGDPISISVLGFTLCLRLAEAANVVVIPQP